jgi:translation initiation factor 1 (eIF-1/SUI1)
MQYEQHVIIHFLANRNRDTNKIAAALKEDFGQNAYALRTVQDWLIEIRRG